MTLILYLSEMSFSVAIILPCVSGFLTREVRLIYFLVMSYSAATMHICMVIELTLVEHAYLLYTRSIKESHEPF